MFTCIYCLADTENDDDICDDCVKMANKDNCVLGHQCRENERDLVQAQSTIHGMNAEIKRLRLALEWAAVQFANHNLPALSHQCRVYAEGE